MKQLYFHFVDFADPPSFRERPSLGFVHETTEPNVCGWTLIDFGDGERHMIVYAASGSAAEANLELSEFLTKHELRIMPVTLDWTKAQVLVYRLNDAIRMYQIMDILGEAEKINLTKVKAQINRKIVQNVKWNRKFENLLTKIEEHERHTNIDLKLEILNECVKLHILLEE